ncbi:MAG TPA: cytochrome c [bacterium]|nr:cytochrome c [bacterium]
MRTFVGMAAIAVATFLLAVPPQSWGQGMGSSRMGGMGGMGSMMAPPPSVGENPLPISKAVIAKGKTIYDANCVVCHGAKGRGDGPAAAGLNPRPPDLRATAMWSDGQIAAQILNGRGQMPPFGKTLDRTAVWSIVHYVRRLQK